MHDRAGKAVRNRRYYSRKRRGITLVHLEVDSRILDFLEKARWLDARDAHKAAEIGQAIKALLETSARI